MKSARSEPCTGSAAEVADIMVTSAISTRKSSGYQDRLNIKSKKKDEEKKNEFCEQAQ